MLPRERLGTISFMEKNLIAQLNVDNSPEKQDKCRIKQYQEQIGLIDGWKVPSTTYWLYADGKPVGFGSIRHFLTDALRKAGGHIGYGIAPKYREKGYGKKILGLLLAEASRLGIDRVLVTIQLNNAASKAVALANGGVITEQTDERIYVWIDAAHI